MRRLILFISLISIRAFSADLNTAISNVNQASSVARAQIPVLTRTDFETWYSSRRLFMFGKADRANLDSAFANGVLPEPFELKYTNDYPGVPPRIVLFRQESAGWSDAESIYDGANLETWETYNLANLLKSGVSIEEPLRKGRPLDAKKSGVFPSSVPVRITEIALKMTDVSVPALKVELELLPENLNDLVDYFSVAYDRETVLSNLKSQLGGAPFKWIALESLFEGWPSVWANRFPAEKSAQDQAQANDVCHGTARQFFSDTLLNGGMDRSTEATEWLLRSSYVLLENGVDPEFGDYLYRAGAHSVRFLLKDPRSKRWIGFSSYSDSRRPYRIWWTDQDAYSSSGAIEPDPSRETSMDVWRPRPEVRKRSRR